MYCLHMPQYTLPFKLTQLPSFKRILDDFVDRLGQLKLINGFYEMLVTFYVSVSVHRSPSEKVTFPFFKFALICSWIKAFL